MSTQTEELRAPLDTFAVRLVIARHSCGDLSQVAAAEKCGLKASTWAAWESGARPRDMAQVVDRISRGLNLPRAWLAWGGPLRPEHYDGPGVGVRTAPSSSPWGGVSPTPIRTMQPKNLAESA